MDTDEDGPDKVRRCKRIDNLENQIICDSQRMAYLVDHTQDQPQGKPGHSDEVQIQPQERDMLLTKMKNVKGELTLLLPCPFPSCLHNTAPKHLEKNPTPSVNNTLATKLTETHITEEQSVKNKKNQQDGFTFPAKTAKKPRILENYTVGALAPIETRNKFQTLVGSDNQPTLTDAAIPVAPPPRSPNNA
ncbi:hypothetical protein TNCT_341221 [Trichonephila clavata]|uniref:Uncharacterized protein n=1 Tax=Trichonephila clavata TaxID=2740835 RepID=A0A8X6M0D2_TRICU|nr:hypothetical protein TNCT_341221 [Trichonephila clavata]